MKHLIKALAEFQQKVPVIHKGTQGYGYSYADLPTIFRVINPILKDCGLTFTQLLKTEDGITLLETIVYHIESGESMSSKVEVPRIPLAKMNDYQSFGSGITYFRRYALAGCLNLITDVDQDAAGQQIRTEEKQDNRISLTANQFNALVGAIKSGQETKEGTPYTVAYAEKHYRLTKQQIQTLNSLSNEQ
jgi:hypothetical protein